MTAPAHHATIADAVASIATRLRETDEVVLALWLPPLDGADPTGLGGDGAVSVSVVPLATRPGRAMRDGTRAHLDLEIDVLIAVTGPADLALAALQRCWRHLDGATDLTPIETTLEPQWWLAMQARPRPHLLVRTTARLPRETPDLPPAREHVLHHDARRPRELAAADAAGALGDLATVPD